MSLRTGWLRSGVMLSGLLLCVACSSTLAPSPEVDAVPSGPAAGSAQALTAAASLEKALGWTLPRWGTTSEQFQQAFPALQEHQPHWCPNETSTATVLELRRPNLEIAGEQVEFIDFQLGSQGFEAVSFDLGLGHWHQRSKKLVRHFEQRLGPPSKRQGETFAFWVLPEVVVSVFGTEVVVTDPRSPSAKGPAAFLESVRP